MGLIRQVLQHDSWTEVAGWLATKALNSDYSLVQAEHWLQQWQQQLQEDNAMRYNVKPPQTESESPANE